MQVQVLEGSPEVFNMLLFPDQNPMNTTFFQQQFQTLSNNVKSAGQEFLMGAKNMYDRINNSEAVRTAKAMIRQAGAFFNPDMIRPLYTLSDIQTAPIVMQRWIMAEPTVRDLYHQQRLDGYADTYVDVEPGQTRQYHYDYRRVMDGVVVDGTDQDDFDFQVCHYPEELKEGDRNLEPGEQVDILNIWEIARYYAEAAKEDPTNPFGGTM